MEIIATTKITNRDGIKAIKNGQKLNKYADIPSPKKPSWLKVCLLYTSPSPRDSNLSRMPSSA